MCDRSRVRRVYRDERVKGAWYACDAGPFAALPTPQTMREAVTANIELAKAVQKLPSALITPPATIIGTCDVPHPPHRPHQTIIARSEINNRLVHLVNPGRLNRCCESRFGIVVLVS